MCRKCSVVGCKSNYDSQLESVTVFTFPKDEGELERWLAALPNRVNVTSSSVVCRKHWPEDAPMKKIKRHFRPIYPPSIFPGVPPSNFQQIKPSPSRNVERRGLSLEVRNSIPDEIKAFNAADVISDWPSFLSKLPTSDAVSVHKLLIVKDSDKCVTLIQITSMTITASITVDDDFSVSAFHKNTKVHLRDLLGCQCHLSRWTQLSAITVRTLSAPLDIRQEILALCNEGEELLQDCEDEEEEKLRFLLDQLSLSQRAPQGRRYSIRAWYIGIRLFLMGQSNYNVLRRSLSLPHPKHVKLCLSDISTVGGQQHAQDVIKSYFKTLTEEQKRSCIMMFDEIYIKPSQRLRGGHNIGKAVDAPSEKAQTVLAIMLKPLRGGSAFMARLIPVYSLKANFLLQAIDEVNSMIENNGGQVLATICDNNFINQQCYRSMSTSEMFLGRFPSSTSTVTLLYDTVHLIKSFRNNWITEGRQELRYSAWDNGNRCTYKAKWSDVTNLWREEQHNVIRETPLTYQACFPAPIERQKVGLVNAVFNDKTVAASKLSGKKETWTLLMMITRLWKIVNVKHPLSHTRLNDPHRRPISSPDDENFKFIETMINLFQDMPGGKGPTRSASLTSQTRDAFKQTLSGLLHLTKHLLSDRSWEYVMLGQFQSDNLEGEFGIFRQMAGGCYYISVEQVLCSARFRELSLFMKADALDDIPHTISPCCSAPINEKEWEAIDTAVENISKISDHELNGLYFVAGYVAMKEELRPDYDVDDANVEHSGFTDLVSRGKLRHPPQWLFNFAQVTYAAFLSLSEKLCVSHICTIFQQLLDAYFLEHSASDSSICRRLCNCFLKGEVRRSTEEHHHHGESSRKLRKLNG